MAITFQYQSFSWLFISIAVFALLFLSVFFWKKKVQKRIGDERLVQQLISNFSPRRFYIKFILITIAFAAGIVALMNPRLPGTPNEITRKGIDVVIALDVSKSMLATDVAPSRLQKARQYIHKLVDAMPNNRYGLVLFAGSAYLQMPLTSDAGAIGLFVNAASPEALPQQGTEIAEAMEKSIAAFGVGANAYKTVLLISDGEEHDERAVSAAEDLSQKGVMINTIGIGSPEGATIPDIITGLEKTDEAGNKIITKLNSALLQEVAAKANGIFVHLQNTDEAVTTIKNRLNQIEKTELKDEWLMNYHNLFMWFTGAMFLFLLIEHFVGERKRSNA